MSVSRRDQFVTLIVAAAVILFLLAGLVIKLNEDLHQYKLELDQKNEEMSRMERAINILPLETQERLQYILLKFEWEKKCKSYDFPGDESECMATMQDLTFEQYRNTPIKIGEQKPILSQFWPPRSNLPIPAPTPIEPPPV